MNAAAAPNAYRPATRALHSVMLVMFVAVFACIELRVLFAKGSDPREALKAAHFMLGLGVLALAVVRIAARLGQATPPIVPAPPAWQHRAALTMHLVLYVWMIAMPLAGWLLLSAEGKPIPFLGLELPALVGKDKPLATLIKQAHELVGRAGYALIGGHVLAALAHHLVQRDNTMVRMWPALGGRP